MGLEDEEKKGAGKMERKREKDGAAENAEECNVLERQGRRAEGFRVGLSEKDEKYWIKKEVEELKIGRRRGLS
jgi:hypothetical protein